MIALESLDGNRTWRPTSIQNHITALRNKGIVNRLKRAHGNTLAVYARMGVEHEEIPFGDKTLKEVVEEVLGDTSLGPIELTVAMLEAGYQTDMEPKALRDAIGLVLRNGDYEIKWGQWTAIKGD